MLQPSSSPVHPPPGSSFPTSEHSAPVSRPSSSKSPPFWQWVSFRELLFVFLVCSFGVLLFRTKDSFTFMSAWKEQIDTEYYSNREFPLEDEKLPPPIVTDLDSDGNQDMLIITTDNHLKQFTFPSIPNVYKPHEAVKVIGDVKRVSLSESKESEGKEQKEEADEEDVKPVAMGAGYLQQYQSMLQVRHQVVAVLMSDWTVLCFDHTLKLLWKVKVHENTEDEGISAKDAAVLVTSVNIHKGDSGSIIVGGRQEDLREPEESLHRMRRVVNEQNQDELLQLLGHFTVYALEGRGGEVRWHHTPQDFQVDTAYPTDQFSFRHLKLTMFRHRQHQGEVSWHQYSEALRKTMPHSWQYATDTHFSLAHFKKDTRPSEKEKLTHHISKVSDLAVEHISGLAFGGQQPHSPSEHVQDPNVLILRSIKGLEVMHLYQGRPLCSLPLSPFHSAHADINGDGVIDHISAIHNPGEGFVSEEGGVEGEVDCYGKAVSMNADSKPLFKHSICKATHWTENFIAVDEWFPQLNKVGRKPVNDELTEPLAPILIPSAYHSAPLKLHMGGVGWDFTGVVRSLFGSPKPYLPPVTSSLNPVETLYDSIFVLSTGRVTSIGPHGEFNWQVDSAADWDKAAHLIYNPEHPSWEEDPEQVFFVHSSFTPSAVPFSPKAYGKNDHILIMGWDVLTLLSGDDGNPVSTIRLRGCKPVAPLQVVDFTGDGWNDIIVSCANGYWGVSLNRKSGFLHSSLLGILVGVVVVVLAVYARQRTAGLLPPIKTAQD